MQWAVAVWNVGPGLLLALHCLTVIVVISGTGDKHYFPANSLIMSVLPHGWLSKAIPEPLVERLLRVHWQTYHACLHWCLCEFESSRAGGWVTLPLCQAVQASFPAFIYVVSLLFELLFFKNPFIDFTTSFSKSQLCEAMADSSASHVIHVANGIAQLQSCGSVRRCSWFGQQIWLTPSKLGNCWKNNDEWRNLWLVFRILLTVDESTLCRPTHKVAKL